MDDMIITGKNDEEHLQHLEEVLKKLREHGMGCEQIRRNASSSTKMSLFVDTALTSTDSTRPKTRLMPWCMHLNPETSKNYAHSWAW